MNDCLALLRAQSTVRARQFGKASAESYVGAAVAVALAVWALRAGTSGLLASLATDVLTTALAMVCVVVALLLASSAFTYSMAFPVELTSFAHRITARALLLSRCLVAALTGAVGATLLIAVLASGLGLGPSDWARVLVLPTLTGLGIGLGLGTGVEAASRQLVRSRTVLPVSRLVTSMAMLVMMSLVTLRSQANGWIALAGAAITAILVTIGAPPLRPEWLPRGGRALGRSVVGSVASSPFWHPLALLWRDALATPLALVSVATIALIGTFLRFPVGAQFATLYVAMWSVIAITPVCILALVTPAKSTAVGPGIYGHRITPGRVAVSAMASALLSAGGVVVVGIVLTSLTTGRWFSILEALHLLLVTASVVGTAMLFAAVRPVRPDAMDSPIILTVWLAVIAAIQVSWAISQTMLDTGLLVVVYMVVVTAVLARGLRSRKPFTT